MLVTAVSLTCAVLLGIAGIWLTFFAEGAWEERMGGYRLMIGILMILLALALLARLLRTVILYRLWFL